MKANGKLLGFLLGGIAAASYGLNPAFTLPLYADGMNPDSVLLLRYGLAIPMVAVMALVRGRSLRIAGKSILPLAILGLLLAISSLTLFMSYNYMAAGIASTLLFVYPVIVAIIMMCLFHEKPTINTIQCILMAVAGIFLLYRQRDGETLNPTGTVIVMISAVSYAIYLVWINQKRLACIATVTITFWVLIFGSMLYAGRLMCGISEFTLPTRWYLWLDAAALALFPTVISLTCTTLAIQKIGSTATAILGALEPVTALLVGLLFYNEGMTGREAAGIVLILVAVSFVVAGGSAQGSAIINHLTRFRKMFPKLRR